MTDRGMHSTKITFLYEALYLKKSLIYATCDQIFAMFDKIFDYILSPSGSYFCIPIV